MNVYVGGTSTLLFDQEFEPFVVQTSSLDLVLKNANMGCGSTECVRFHWERIDLWGDLLASLPKECMWFLCGD